MQFMPGGGGAKQANYLYNAAAKNGAVIGFPLKYVAINQMLGRKGLKYDAAKFRYLGSLGPINSAVAILKDKAPRLFHGRRPQDGNHHGLDGEEFRDLHHPYPDE